MIKFESKKADNSYFNYIATKNIKLPTACPVCGADVMVMENGQVRCMNPVCKMKVVHKYINFFKTLEIENAGDAFCKEAANEGNTIKWLLSQALDNPASYEKYAGGINGSKVIAALTKKLNEPITAATFFALFDVDGFGERKLEKVEALLMKQLNGDNVTEAEFAAADGWADKSSADWIQSFNEIKNDVMLCKPYFKFGAKAPVAGKLSGKSFCFTGKAEAVDGGRKACEKLVAENGGTVASGVSKTLSYLVTDDASSGSAKSVKAAQLGIPVITSFEFLAMING